MADEQRSSKVELGTTLTSQSESEGKIDQLREHGNLALGFFDAHSSVTFTPEEEARVVRKIDLVLMPLVSINSSRANKLYFSLALTDFTKLVQMLVSYMIQYMDKSVMAQAAVYDLIPSLDLKGQDYSWCS